MGCYSNPDFWSVYHRHTLGRNQKGHKELAMGFFSWLNALLHSGNPTPNQQITPKPDAMNQGDFHSGPDGYSPGTAYPETFYGSQGANEQDSQGATGHNEGDFNR
jgi:hypothetical protein